MPHAASMLARCLSVVFFVFTLQATLQGQGTMGLVADPVDSKELAIYLKRYVQPSFEEWIAVGDAQDDYLEKYDVLRDGPIAEVLAESLALHRSGTVPSSEEVRELMASLKALSARIHRLDTQLFDSIAVVLPEQKLVGLERVRLARKRARLQVGLAESMGMGADMDLWTYINKVKFNDQESEVILARIQPYERQSARLLAKGSDAAGSILLAIAEEVEALGIIIDQSNMTPEVSAEFMAAYMRGYEKAMERNASVASDLRTFNARTLRDLTNVLDHWKARQIKSAYFANVSKMMIEELHFARAVPEDAQDLPEFEELVKALDSNENLLGNLKDDFDELALAYVVEDHGRLDRMLKLVNKIDPLLEKLVRTEEILDDGDGKPTIREQVVELQRARTKAQLESTRRLLAMIESDGSIQLKVAARDPRNLVHFGVQSKADATSRVKESTSPRVVKHYWGIAPQAMGVEILSKVQAGAAQEAWSQAVLETLHEEYLAEWEEKVVPIDQQLKGDKSSVYAWDSDLQEPVLDRTSVAKFQKSQDEVMAGAAAVDARFFENLVLTMPEESANAMLLLRAERNLERVSGGSQADLPAVLLNIGYIRGNPISVLNELELSQEERRTVNQLVFSHEKAMFASRSALQRAVLKAARVLSDSEAVMFDPAYKEDSRARELLFNSYERLWEEYIEQEVRLLRENVARTHEAFFEALRVSLRADINQEFRKAYRVAKSPRSYIPQLGVKDAPRGSNAS